MRLSNIFRITILAIILYTLAAFIFGFIEIQNSMSLIPVSWWFSFLSLPLFTHVVLAFRWHYLLLFLSSRLSFFQSCNIYISGLALMAAPGRTGELIRALWLNKNYHMSKSVGLAATFSERLSDLISALLIMFLLLSSNKQIFIFITLLMLIFLFSRPCKDIFKKIILTLSQLSIFSFLNNKLVPSYTNMFLNFRNVLSLRILPLTILFGIIIWLFESLFVYYLFIKLGVNIDFRESVIIRTGMGLGGALSFLPAGLITSEASALAISLAYGSGRSEAIVVTLIIRLYTLFVPFLIGLIVLNLNKQLSLEIPNISSR
ncbi:lysylphosphatidylglycerol synthase transmembrane domain-containing protein [Prochlorococcus marinus]|uniref:lysylphosphatidylglycerol synthase transmembrane domain-containing protein n=1 Tax=Prochlorococcus marinus TaxID=1219 RepID=UPI0022B5D7E6|nr:lysylphosphatidylglycerol synthase transmembrane domain-containing protein [Prochlorococcus marinus]